MPFFALFCPSFLFLLLHSPCANHSELYFNVFSLISVTFLRMPGAIRLRRGCISRHYTMSFLLHISSTIKANSEFYYCIPQTSISPQSRTRVSRRMHQRLARLLGPSADRAMSAAFSNSLIRSSFSSIHLLWSSSFIPIIAFTSSSSLP